MAGWFIAGFVAGELVGLIVAAILTGTEGRKTEMSRKQFYIAIGIILAVITALLVWVFSDAAGEQLARCWIMCKPGSQVNVRHNPSKKSETVGYLEAGDWFETDGESKNGFIRCFDIGEWGEGWVYCGYVVTEEPVQVNEQYVCAAVKRVACRKWMGGPQVDGQAWLNNGSNVQVFYMADGWAITNRGYIKTEWLDANPK